MRGQSQAPNRRAGTGKRRGRERHTTAIRAQDGVIQINVAERWQSLLVTRGPVIGACGNRQVLQHRRGFRGSVRQDYVEGAERRRRDSTGGRSECVACCGLSEERQGDRQQGKKKDFLHCTVTSVVNSIGACQ